MTTSTAVISAFLCHSQLEANELDGGMLILQKDKVKLTSLDSLQEKGELNMKTRLLIFGAFIVGAIGAAVVIALSIFCCEPHALAVVELDGAWIKGYSQTQDPQPFIDSVSDKNPNVVFRHNLKLVTTPSAQPTQPPELQDTKNIGTICINCRGNAIGGLHVTQRIGYNDIASLEATLNLLTTPTPPPSSNR